MRPPAVAPRIMCAWSWSIRAVAKKTMTLCLDTARATDGLRVRGRGRLDGLALGFGLGLDEGGLRLSMRL